MSTENEDLEIKEQPDGTLHVTDPKDVVEEKDEDDDSDDESGDSKSDVEASGDESAEDAGETDERPASKTEENRLKRVERKARMRERTEKMRNELAARDAVIEDQNRRLALLERKSTGSEQAQLDNEIRKAAEAYNYYKGQIASSHGIPDAGPIVADATEKMVLASRRYEDLNRVKQQNSQAQNQPSAIDPVLQRHGQSWMEKNSWYAPDSGDEDSAIVLAIDTVLVKEGWNPRTPEYWEELQRRVDKKLPHRAKKSYNRDKESRPRSVVTGSGRESSGSNGGNVGYTLSKERVSAMKDAGIWDDPKARADMIRRYRETDKQQSA